MIERPPIIENFRYLETLKKLQAEAGVSSLDPGPIKWIGTDDDFYPGRVDRYGNKFKPEAIVCHVMQGTLQGTDAWFNNPAVDVSTHFGIGKNGEIHQYVRVEDGAWGNGDVQKPSWSGLKYYPDGRIINPNLYTISVEFEGRHSTDSRGQLIPDWEPTEKQVEAAIRLFAWLCWTYGIPADEEHIIGHNRLNSVNRPYCPGPKFPFGRIIKEVRNLILSRTVMGLFADVKGHWAEASISRLAKIKTPEGQPLFAGVNRNGVTYFEPDRPVTRAELAVILDRVLKILGK